MKRRLGFRLVTGAMVFGVALALTVTSPTAQNVLVTPAVPMELPIEVEIELSPAGSLKQAAIWPELYRLLKRPYAFTCPADNPATLDNESYSCTATIPRRPRFAFGNPGALLPGLKIYSPGYNFLTAQPLRTRTSDGEVSWDQPGPMFDPVQAVTVDAFNTPTQLRTVIGHLVACPNVDNPATPVNETYQAALVPADFCAGKPAGSLVVFNPGAHPAIPPNGTVVAEAAYVNGVLYDDGEPVTRRRASKRRSTKRTSSAPS